MALRGKQQRFVEEYLLDLNATQAAIRAGYSGKTARSIGQENLTKPDIQMAITAEMGARSQRTKITRDKVLEELAVIDFSNVKHYEIDDLGNLTLAKGVPESAYRAVSSLKKKIRHSGSGDEREVTYETEVRFWDKVGAIRLTAQHLGMLNDTETTQHTEVHVHVDTAKGRVAKRLAQLAGQNGHANGNTP